MASLHPSLLSQKTAAACGSRQLLQLQRQFSLIRISSQHLAAIKATSHNVVAQKRYATMISRDSKPDTAISTNPFFGSDTEMDALLDSLTSDGIPKPFPGDGAVGDRASFDDMAGPGFGNTRRAGVFQLEGHARSLPISASYFTRQPTFNDNLIRLQQIYRKHGSLPMVEASQVKRITWHTLKDFKAGNGEEITPSEYKRCLAMVKKLHRIHPRLKPSGIDETIAPFVRTIHQADTQTKKKILDRFGRAVGVGRRKTSTARAWVVEGTGEMIVNGKSLSGSFGRVHDRESAMWALRATDRTDKYNVWALVDGGGTTGQAEALTLAVARALLIHEPALKTALRKGTFIFDMKLCFVFSAHTYQLFLLLHSWLHYPRCEDGGAQKARSRQGKKEACLGQEIVCTSSGGKYAETQTCTAQCTIAGACFVEVCRTL
ncbi:37S ribosomal protein S9, mitochondrial [Sporothrix epigloea]|uniref:37S ribosomal protein S9, mitochondrial n=1 Tax=Sporothrix epigloea TaxID=1892477 RepID=A0ABP0D7G8_9PEZI